MIELVVAGSFEGPDVATLGVDSRHDVLDEAVFTGGVHALEDQKHGPAVLGVELFLQFAEQLDALLQQFVGFVFVFEATRGVGVMVLQAKFLTLGNAKRLRELGGFLAEFFGFHGDDQL